MGMRGSTINSVVRRLRVLLRLRVGFIIHSLEFGRFFVFRVFFACHTAVCLQLHVDIILKDIKGFSGNLQQKVT